MSPESIGCTLWVLPPASRLALSKPIDFMEHRWGARVGVDIAVRLTAHPFAAREGQLTNVSVSGALIKSGVEFRLLSRIEVLFIPLDEKCKVSMIPAYVTRRSQGRIGVAWCESAPRAVIDLLRFLRESTAT
jgi:PilZ domain-containing protein